jgi:hypothetical protein
MLRPRAPWPLAPQTRHPRPCLTVPFARALCGAALIVGCHGATPTLDAGAGDVGVSGDVAAEDDRSACNPLGDEATCALPWPSMYYTRVDPRADTGYRLALDPRALPVSASTRTAGGDGTLDPAPWNRLDGFSPSAPALAWFPRRLDPASLTGALGIAASVAPGSATVLLDMATNRRVPHIAELDATAGEGQRQLLIVRPAVRLEPAHRYAVVVTRALRSLDGGALAPTEGFRALREGHPERDPRLARVAGRYAEIFASIDAVGIARDDVLLAWDYVTASERYLTGPVRAMRDRALAVVGPTGATFSITRVDEAVSGPVLRRVEGTVRVPLFLRDPAPGQRSAMNYDALGEPAVVPGATHDVPFVAIVPHAAATATGPLPMLLFGHGLFASARDQLFGTDVPSGFLQRFADDHGYVLVATDWTGLSAADLGDAGLGLADFNRVTVLTDRLQQSLVNAMVLFRTARERFDGVPAFQVQGRGVIDPGRAYYFGVSLGGIMGASFLGYSPDCERAALNVNGGNWSLLMQRSLAWPQLSLFLRVGYRAPEDHLLLLDLAQSQFDFTDPINLAPHLTRDVLPGSGAAKSVLSQQSLGDPLVSTLGAEMVARTAGLPLLAPALTSPYGLAPAPAPLASAMSQWSIRPATSPPDTNRPIAADNGAHGAIGVLPAMAEQVARFLRPGGMVEQTCAGPCTAP